MPANDPEDEFSGRSTKSLAREIRLLRSQKERLISDNEREILKLQRQNEAFAADAEAVSKTSQRYLQALMPCNLIC